MAVIAIIAAPTYAKDKKKKIEKPTEQTVPMRNIPRDVSERYRHFFYGAMQKKIAGDTRSAIELLSHCATIDPEAAETYFYLAECYAQMDNDSMQVAMLRKASELRPDNATYKESLIPIYLQEGQLKDAISTMEELLSHYPERTDMLNILLHIYNYQDDNANCLDILNRLEVQEGQKEETTMGKVQILTRMKRYKEAHEVFSRFCDEHPLDLNYRVMFGNWLMGQKHEKEALAQYKAVLKEEPDNQDAMLSMYDYYIAQEMTEQAVAQRERILLSPSTNDDNRLTMIKMWVRDSEDNATDSLTMLSNFDRYISAAPNKQDMMLLKAMYMDLKKMDRDSINSVYKQILNLYPDNTESRLHLIESAWANENAKAMIEFSRPAIEYDPDNWTFYYFLAVGQTLEGQHRECIETVNASRNAIKIANDNDKKLASDLFELLGDAYHAVGEDDNAFSAYDECLNYNPDNLGCLNNYAYYLTEAGRDYEKAAEMSFRTIKEQPSNSTFLDTYAWILYKQERYEEAVIYMDMAIQFLNPDIDPETYLEHSKLINEKVKK